MNLEMVKKMAASLVIEDAVDSIAQSGFLADSYFKAFGALHDYIELSDQIRLDVEKMDCSSSRNGVLYRSPQNIVAFSGRRGSGKSSTMLSFSEVLSAPKRLERLCNSPKFRKDYAKLKGRRFIVLDPIDPTTLEENQSILSVVLSRLLFKAEESWNQHISFYGSFQEKESKKTELLSLARQCLNGISTIKSKKGVVKELSDLQKVGDSSILKKGLYEFVDLFLQFSISEKAVDLKNCMLVLQIDDTDCQISQGYEVMEDIRKYLTIPNVLILMATDMKLLRQVLTRHYLSDFHENVDREMIGEKELWQLGEKHLAKLMPPSCVVHLPNIDEAIRDKTDIIRLYYYAGDTRDKEKNLLMPRECKDPEDYKSYDFQAVILRYIYRKTHIVFVSHDAYVNNIIPTTLRGLAHLLNLLSSMEDVPEIDLTRTSFDAKYLAESLKAQFPILERNLNLFEEYFLHDWIQAKLPLDKIEIVEKFSNQAPDQRISFITKELITYYRKQADTPEKTYFDLSYDNPSYTDLDELLRRIQGTKDSKDSAKAIRFRQVEDFYFIFAIRTLLTIKNNKDVLRIKRRTVNHFEANQEEKIIFDYLKGKTSLPTGLYLDPVSLFGQQLVADRSIRDGGYNTDEEPFFISAYFWLHDGVRSFNFTGAVIHWLTPRKEDCKNLDQKKLYQVQELTVLVSANCDVQEAARKAVARKAKEKFDTKADNLSSAVKQGLWLLQSAVVNINQGMFEEYKSENEEESFWKINEQITKHLNSFGKKELAHNSNSGETGETGKEAAVEETQPRSYPTLDEDLPEFYNLHRIEDYKQRVLSDYGAKLRAHFENIGHPLNEKCESLLTALVTFDFHQDDENDKEISNRKDFFDARNSLYEALDVWMLQLPQQADTDGQDGREHKDEEM